MISPYIGLVLATLLSLIFTPFVKKFAIRIGAIDQINERKVHEKAMPRLGGLAIYLSFLFSYIIISIFFDIPYNPMIFSLFIGGFIMVLTGALDDKFDISPKKKLLGQFVSSLVVVGFGMKVEVLNVPFVSEPISLGWFSIPFTIFWIIAITNAVNLIDGLDGLASGVSAIASLGIFVISLLTGNVLISLVSLLFFGSILGFLFYNFYPAKIFMGDSGSLFLGYALATFSLLEFKEITLVSSVVAFFILAIPISDTLYAILRRILNKQPVSMADKNHLHHSLLRLGFSHRNTVLIIYAISAVLSSVAVILTQFSTVFTFLAIFIYLLIFHIFARSIGMLKK